MILLVSNSRLFKSFSWKTISSIVVLVNVAGSIVSLIDIEQYVASIMVEVVLSIHLYMFVPSYILSYSIIDKQYWKLLVYINVMLVPCVHWMMQVLPRNEYIYPFFEITCIWSIIKINSELSEMDL